MLRIILKSMKTIKENQLRWLNKREYQNLIIKELTIKMFAKVLILLTILKILKIDVKRKILLQITLRKLS